MKSIFLLGGLAGFTTAAVTGWLVGSGPDRICLDAMVGALVGAVLFRWFWGIVLRGMREIYLARQQAAAAAIAAAAAATAAATPAPKPRA